VLRVAAVQDAPVFLDTEATLTRVLHWIERAGDRDVQLLAFGETYLPGYPFWLSLTDAARFDEPTQKDAYRAYLDAAVTVDGPELAEIAAVARHEGVFVVLGVAERVGASIYCSAISIDPVHGILAPHRKLMPTHEERLVWAQGDGHGLRTHDVRGARVGVLCCWENWMPQARHALYADGVQVHVALWPGSVRNTEQITRFAALEGRSYVVSASSVLQLSDVPAGFPLRDRLPTDAPYFHDGGTAIAGPDGQWIVPPLRIDRTLVVADLDLAAVARERQNFDPVGHYSRADVFRVEVDRTRRRAVEFRD
jgi:nitrilase